MNTEPVCGSKGSILLEIALFGSRYSFVKRHSGVGNAHWLASSGLNGPYNAGAEVDAWPGWACTRKLPGFPSIA